jgi:hypothetical protein
VVAALLLLSRVSDILLFLTLANSLANGRDEGIGISPLRHDRLSREPGSRARQIILTHPEARVSGAIYLSHHPAKIFELRQDSSHRGCVCFGVPRDIHATHFSEMEGKFVPGPEQGSCLGDLLAQEICGFSITAS